MSERLELHKISASFVKKSGFDSSFYPVALPSSLIYCRCIVSSAVLHKPETASSEKSAEWEEQALGCYHLRPPGHQIPCWHDMLAHRRSVIALHMHILRYQFTCALQDAGANDLDVVHTLALCDSDLFPMHAWLVQGEHTAHTPCTCAMSRTSSRGLMWSCYNRQWIYVWYSTKRLRSPWQSVWRWAVFSCFGESWKMLLGSDVVELFMGKERGAVKAFIFRLFCPWLCCCVEWWGELGQGTWLSYIDSTRADRGITVRGISLVGSAVAVALSKPRSLLFPFVQMLVVSTVCIQFRVLTCP